MAGCINVLQIQKNVKLNPALSTALSNKMAGKASERYITIPSTLPVAPPRLSSNNAEADVEKEQSICHAGRLYVPQDQDQGLARNA